MSDPEKTIDCPHHGPGGRAAFACRHLLSGGKGLGFHTGYDPETPDDAWPDAWCDACDALMDSEDGWTDRVTDFADVGLICDRCYEVARDWNWRQDDAAFERLLHDAVEYLERAQDAVTETFQLGHHDRYDWNQGAGTLVFSREGQPSVIADVQFVGSVSSTGGTWFWSWANESVLESAKSRIREVRAYGEDHRFWKLAGARWEAAEEDGWDMSAVAAFLLRARGVYRAPHDDRFTFLVLTDVRWAQ